ncbi:MAG TPA: DUF309 domain-containing protein [Thermoanaerobaculia bacterium]|nr:DUF309 domain-containing protein [Thermoanaerobaculia bacterium]
MSERVLHPDLTPEKRRTLVREGVERFNAGRFYDAHESWEEVWRSTTPEPRELFQGLVQIAAGMHHVLDRGRPEPGRRVLGKGRRRLEALPPVCCGLDVEALVAAVRAWEEWLPGCAGPAPPPPALRVLAADQVA